MVSVTLASRYHSRYQSRSSMYICGLILRNFAELAEEVLIIVKGNLKGVSNTNDEMAVRIKFQRFEN